MNLLIFDIDCTQIEAAPRVAGARRIDASASEIEALPPARRTA